jgi:arylsulfatase A-like enzyme
VQRVAPEELDAVSLGLPPATEVWQRTMGIDDGIGPPEERFPKRPIPFRARSDLTHTAFVAEQTMAYLEDHRDSPFFCIAGFYSPHSPWVAPQEFIARYDPRALTLPRFPPAVDAQRTEGHYSDDELRAARQGYYAMVSEVDHHVGRIMDHLDALDLSGNTIVIYTSDHGEWLGEHLRYGKGHPGHDCISRVPFVIRWPDEIAYPGRTSHEMIEAIDIVPTLLECAGIPTPGYLQGQSLVPLLAATERDGRSSALTEGEGWKTLRLGSQRYVVEADGREALYDLERDPCAYDDVSADRAYHDALMLARHALLARLLARERPLRREWAY